MDTSETYIKMCAKAEEIQKGWNPAGHDYLVYVPKLFEKNYGHGNNLWLPRQDQLQEMVGGFDAGFVDWNGWIIMVYPEQRNPFSKPWRFDSMEQLWLAFVMSELYQKKWEGSKWIRK